jgi:hypothetical protein
MFEAILEECSNKRIELEEEDPPQDTLLLLPQEISYDHKAEEQPNAWFLMD